MSNDTVFSIDWVSFTVHHGEGVSIWDVLHDAGLDWVDLLISAGHGGMGYESLYWLDLGDSKPIKVYFSRSLPYSTLVFSGQGVDWVGGGVALFDLIGSMMGLGFDVKFTRVDLAFDTPLFTPADFMMALQAGRVNTRVERRKIMEIRELDGDGHTIYLGSALSDVRLRVYRKIDAVNHPLGDVFTRVELQMRSARADAIGHDLLLIGAGDWYSHCLGVLRGYVDFVGWDGWVQFIGSVPRHWHKLGASVVSMSKSVAWLFAQVSVTLSVIRAVMSRSDSGGWDEFIASLDDYGKSRLKPRHTALMRAYEGVDVSTVIELVKSRLS